MIELPEGLYRRLINRAVGRFGVIKPCGRARTFLECFTKERHGTNTDIYFFWYNDEGGSTHIEYEERGRTEADEDRRHRPAGGETDS